MGLGTIFQNVTICLTVNSERGPLHDKSLDFAIRVVNLHKYLKQKKKEFVMSRQLMRCGTSVGAMVREAQRGESRADFIHKLSIALKEANEAEYWIILLFRTDYLTEEMYNSIYQDCSEILALLVSIIKTTKKNKK